MRAIIGIDPGIGGALTLLDDTGVVLSCLDMPIIQSGTKNTVNEVDLGIILRQWAQHRDGVRGVVERVGPRPGEGAAGAFSFGNSFGCIRGAMGAVGVPFFLVMPAVWKKAMHCPAEKDGARLRAGQLLPDAAHHWPLKKHDGRAESALIALYAHQFRPLG